MGKIKEGFNIKLEYFNEDELEMLRGKIIFLLDEKIIYEEETDIIEPLIHFFDEWVNLLKYNEGTLFLDNYEKTLHFIQQENMINISSSKEIISVERVQFFNVVFDFCKEHIEKLISKVPGHFNLNAAYKQIIDLEKLDEDFITTGNLNVYRKYSSESRYEISWSDLKNERNIEILPQFSRDNDFLYVGNGPANKFSKIDILNKKTLWTEHLNFVESGIVFCQQDDKVFVGDISREEEKSKLVCMSAKDGKKLWELELEGEIKGVYFLPNNVLEVMVVMDYGLNIILDIETGKEKQTVYTGIGGENLKVRLFSDYYVLIGECYEEGELIDPYIVCMTAVDLNSNILWRENIDCRPNTPTYLENHTALIVGEESIQRWDLKKESPELILEIDIEEEDYLYVVADNLKIGLVRHIYDMDDVVTRKTCLQFFGVDDGKEIYECLLPGEIKLEPNLVDNMCVVVMDNGKVYCIDLVHNQIKWETRFAHDVIRSPRYVEDKIYMSSHELEVKCLDIKSGKVEFTLYLPKFILESDSIHEVIKTNNLLYFTCISGNVFEVRER
ncbi:PQQ-binding-like beta-propeller repeat protein [Bacillus cereus group sp. BfR-BA-01379]|uniref:outer membrane protein assembly factor BamB family protein n=1 Tax=Bacillus cereus group sp. BfR-BA-01379 TaxID=2920323 RepID=UPI001F58F902|nr:PQQ-binding-like beta-propeller repeat protein [Bacillus cereus group sp. BfR-BA-01379]